MSTNLSHGSEAFLAEVVAQGVYTSTSEALEAAVALLRQRQHLLEQLQASRRQLDDGSFVEFDEICLREHFATLLPRAAARQRL